MLDAIYNSLTWQLEKFRIIFFLGEGQYRVINAVIDWISTMAANTDSVRISFGTYSATVAFMCDPEKGCMPKMLGKNILEPKTFIIRQPSGSAIPEGWIAIFSSPDLEILENKTRAPSVTPLRWRLSREEKMLALRIARKTLEELFSQKKHKDSDPLPERFSLKSDLGVALWVDGRLRGSSVIRGKRLEEGIRAAALSASRDSRFKPIGSSDLARLRIEITIISDLRIPLSDRELSKNAIYAEKGYGVRFEERIGWFFPEVFNVRKFKNLSEFLNALVKEKAKVESPYSRDNVFMFEVDDFIESDRHVVSSLYGPLIKPVRSYKTTDLKSSLKSTADWLCRIQEPDGNIPPISDPLTGRMNQIDWPRLAFSLWALAEFGNAIESDTYARASERGFEYLKRHLLLGQSDEMTLIGEHHTQMNRPVISNRMLTLAYFGQLSRALKKLNESLSAAREIAESINTVGVDTITKSQICSFLRIFSKDDEVFRKSFETLAAALKRDFMRIVKDQKAANLAIWAELAHIFLEADSDFSATVYAWLKRQQHYDGSFPTSPSDTAAYTRGTGKILEVLAADPIGHNDAITRSLQWLATMQYNDDNMFFIRRELQPIFMGAFRHDFLNPEAWIDSSGHFLLAGTRLLHGV
ncbi:AMMECR1 domain-containing protein [Candidatus Parcubacteria bacterium]|nr:MAG: AMMECR1 domain-containing protein [Candidatus Parcubacteria bacterium]